MPVALGVNRSLYCGISIAEALEIRVHLCQLRLIVAPGRVRPGRQRQIIAVAAVTPFTSNRAARNCYNPTSKARHLA